MTFEESIVEKLKSEFQLLSENCVVQRQRRIIVEVPQDIFMGVIEFVKYKLNFTMLCTITGLDLGDNLQAIYHLGNDTGVVLNLKLSVPKANPVINTVTSIFEGAVLYERELIDLLGFEVRDIPAGGRYPLPDFWPEGQYPLRKDWKAPEEGFMKGGRTNG